MSRNNYNPYAELQTDCDLAHDHRALHRELLAAEKSIDDSGSVGGLVALGGTPALIAGLHYRLFGDALNDLLADFRHWGFYIAIVVIAFLSLGVFANWLEVRCYRKHRDAIHRLARESNLSWDQVLVATCEDPALKRVHACLRKDPTARLDDGEQEPQESGSQNGDVGDSCVSLQVTARERS